MSTLVEVLGKIRNSGGTVTAENGQVHFKIRPGSLTDTDRAILAKHRNDVFHMLTPVDVDRTPPHSGKTAIVSTATAETDHDQHPEPEVEVVEDLDQWLLENTIEPVVCDTCGGLERWEDLAGNWHCTDCDPPLTAARLRERAARLRRDVATIQQAAKARRVVA